MVTARKDMAETATSRSNVYGLLATVFRAEPSAAFLAHLGSTDVADAFGSLDLSLGVDDRESSSEDLAVEYTRLFIGPGPHVSPHESVNIEGQDALEAALWGPQTVKVKKFIEAAGLEFDASFTGMPDHVSAELEFMQRLAAREAEAWSAPNEELAANIQRIQERFLDEHLSRWAPRFCERVIEMSEHAFYRVFSELTKDFVEYDRNNLQIYIAEIGNKECKSH